MTSAPDGHEGRLVGCVVGCLVGWLVGCRKIQDNDITDKDEKGDRLV